MLGKTWEIKEKSKRADRMSEEWGKVYCLAWQRKLGRE